MPIEAFDKSPNPRIGKHSKLGSPHSPSGCRRVGSRAAGPQVFGFDASNSTSHSTWTTAQTISILEGYLAILLANPRHMSCHSQRLGTLIVSWLVRLAQPIPNTLCLILKFTAGRQTLQILHPKDSGRQSYIVSTSGTRPAILPGQHHHS